MILPLLFGLFGVAILVSLGLWQVQRLAWKQGILAQIEARITAAPVALPATPMRDVDQYLPVTVTGDFTGTDLAVLASVQNVGPVHRLIAVMVLADGRRILVDRGYVAAASGTRTTPAQSITITGNLLWPDEVDGWTPTPDQKTGLWFARDLPAMAAELGSEPVLVVARNATGTATPLPVGSAGIPNNHLNYAITWFSLAAIWVGMTGYLLWRIRQRTV